MKKLSQKYAVKDLDGQFVVVDRQLWDQENPEAISSIRRATMLAAGPFGTQEEADAALDRLTS